VKEQTWIDPACDRSFWGTGPWNSEPDKMQWKDEATGLACLMVRQATSGHLCGYVGVEPGHALYGKGYDDVPSFDVHGGLTFADKCQEGPLETTVCHLPEPGEPDGLWWFGFDCMHARDLSPSSAMLARRLGDARLFEGNVYRDLAYVRGECAKLAEQINAVKSTS
jgi:hypothetical protein